MAVKVTFIIRTLNTKPPRLWSFPASSMETLASTFPIFTANPNFHTTKPSKPSKVSVSIKPPPPDFDFRAQILEDSRATIAQTHPQLLDLADNGSLVVIEKRLFGPVPAWRTEFVEPEEIWLLGTTHISSFSAADVERVVEVVNPDNVVVELCRSRQVLSLVNGFWLKLKIVNGFCLNLNLVNGFWSNLIAVDD